MCKTQYNDRTLFFAPRKLCVYWNPGEMDKEKPALVLIHSVCWQLLKYWYIHLFGSPKKGTCIEI